MIICQLLPFALFLVSVAIVPLWKPMIWEKYGVRWSLVAGLSAWILHGLAHGFLKASTFFLHSLDQDVLPFLAVLWCLFGLSKRLVWHVHARPSPWINGSILFLGSLLAGCIGTTGASLLVTQTLLELNRNRQYKVHTLVFAIFLVGNIGGLLSTLGDPPLLLGCLQGVPWWWPTKHLWGTYLFHAMPLLLIYGAIDYGFYRQETCFFSSQSFRITFEGWPYLLGFLGLGLVMILPAFGFSIPLPFWLKMLVMGYAYARIRKEGQSWEPMREVSWILCGVMMTALPVWSLLENPQGLGGSLCALLSPDGSLSLQRCFWMTGLCSSILDNAPAYLLFGKSIGALPWKGEHVGLTGVSSGAVLMGALTYIGNAPNLLIRSMAQKEGIRMPAFLTYCVWSGSLLLPLFMLYGWLFFE